MSLSTPFIKRPIATTLLTAGVALAGIIAFFFLPVAPLPQVDFPTIMVQASMPGAAPETMATSVATPLERHLGQIADVTEMTSQSTLGNTRVTLQFGLDRNIDGAARDVQAAIAAARADLPVALKSNPTYRKANPADAPIMILGLTSDTVPTGQIYDAASTILAQKLSQIQGVGQVTVGGGSLPAVRVELNPRSLFKYGIGLEDVRTAVAASNAHTPKGAIDDNGRTLQIYNNDQARKAADYQNLIVTWRDNAPVRLSDLGEVKDSVEDLRNQGFFNGKPSVVVIITKQPGSNIVDTVDRIKVALPQLKASIPRAINLEVAMDRTTTIRASLHDVERTLCIAVALVVFVVFLFLRNGSATLIPSVAVPVSLVGTFGAMYLMGYSLDNLSLMALTVATGFVVDDAIVVLENITRHIEAGMGRFEAALQGAKEVGFTVLSMSLSLIAVFVPILLMGGIVGRLFREFAVTLSAAIFISLVVSLTTTPMMCSRFLKHTGPQERRGKKPLQRFYRFCQGVFARTQRGYDRVLVKALHHEIWVLLIFFLTIGLNFYLYIIAPKGFFPQQDTGQITGSAQADQNISFQAMRDKMTKFVHIVKDDPAVATVAAFTGGSQTNSGFVFASLKPLAERGLSADAVINRLRGKLSVAGAVLYMQAAQDIRMGGRAGNAQYQYTLQADSLDDLRQWAPKLTDQLKRDPVLTDVNSDQQDGGLETDVTVDRDTASRLGLTLAQIDNTLYDAYGQRQVSNIYNPLNQYHVVMEAAPEFWQSPETLNQIYVEPPLATSSVNVLTGTVPVAAETMVPLSAVASFAPGKTPLSVNHQGHFAATTISFNLAPGKSLSDATLSVARASNAIGMPASVHGGFQGTAQVFQQSLANEPILILAAFLAVYIVLGILYESYIHPITILSTIPSAGVGALLALKFWPTDWTYKVWQTEFTIMALIGIILLIGIVKKNAIMMIDVALIATRERGFSSHMAIYHACLLRFRPIMMTTMAALFGALPLAIGFGEGSELRKPLGIAVVGGLLVSQMLTLFTTPVIYLYFDRMRPHFKISLWTETLRSIKSGIRQLPPYTVGLYIVLIAFDQLIIHKLHLTGLQNAIYLSWEFFLFTFLRYALTVKFLRFSGYSPQPKLSIGGYVYWLGQMLKKYAEAFAWLLLPAFGEVLFRTFPALSEPAPIVFFMIRLVFFIIGIFFFLRTMTRYELVSPLAILHHNKPLKTSWGMTKGSWNLDTGNAFRIFINNWILNLFVTAIFAIVLAAYYLMTSPNNFSEIMLAPAVIVLLALYSAVSMVVNAIYACVTYQTLSSEQKGM